MIAPLVVSQNMSLFLAIILGIFFGISLERGGLGNPHKLSGVFYLRDFTVLKVMFSAILVAAFGLYLLSDLGLLDIKKIWIVPTFFWPQLVGGLLFGVGFVVSGYCPGTVVAGFAGGRLDALAVMLGIGAGSLLFALVFPLIRGFYMSSFMERITLPKLFNVNHWVVIFFLFIMAGVMFYIIELHEKKKGGQ